MNSTITVDALAADALAAAPATNGNAPKSRIEPQIGAQSQPTAAPTAPTVDAMSDAEKAAALGWKPRNIEALQRKKPTQYIVDSLLALPSLSILYGAPGSLKSMILADLAACVAGGKRWLDQMPEDDGKPGISLATTAARVLWLDFDNGNELTEERIGAVRRAHGLTEPGLGFDYLSMATPHLDASNSAMMEYATSFVRASDYRFVVVDNLGLVTGGTEENSAKMSDVLGGFRRMAESANCAVVLVHHQRKSGANGGADGIRKGETMRGSSAIEAALDLALLVERMPESDTILLTPTKARRAVPFTAAAARFTYDHFEGTRDLERARFFGLALESKSDAATEMLRALILECIKKAPGINGKTLVSAVTEDAAVTPGFGRVPTEKKVRGMAKKMAEDGLLTINGSGSERNYFPS